MMYQQVRDRLLPELENSQLTYVRLLAETARSAGRWLDIGCGHSLFPDWLPTPPIALEGRAIGLDPDLHALAAHRALRHKVGGDAHRLPFLDETFDLVTANMVVEHISEPTTTLRELHRVLRPSGRLLLHTPNIYGYTTRLARLIPEPVKARLAHWIQGRQVEDVYPAYYRLNSGDALRTAAEEIALELVRCDHVLTSPQFFRVPGLVHLELRLLRHLARPAHEKQRPVLIALFRKPA